jgi:hypothetical protein
MRPSSSHKSGVKPLKVPLVVGKDDSSQMRCEQKLRLIVVAECTLGDRGRCVNSTFTKTPCETMIDTLVEIDLR